MAIIQNGITFTNVSRVGIGSPFNNVVNGDIQNESDLKDYIDAGEEYKNIQSVLIDWNGATLGTTTINTTGELLSYISGVANNIPEVPADVITESKLSTKGYITSSDLTESSQNIEDWVSSNYVEKPTNTGILAGVVTLREKTDLYDNDQVKAFIQQNVAVNLHKDNWKYTSPFNLAYVSTSNKDVDGALYGTIKCTTNSNGYLYIITVDPLETTNGVMGDVLPSSTFINEFSYISSNTLPSALDLKDMFCRDVSIFAYVKSDGNGIPPTLREDIIFEDEWTTDKAYTIHANLLIYETNLFIGGGTTLNIYTSFNYTPPTVPPTSPTTEETT